MRFHRLDLNLLVVLDALLREQSVSKAARQLNLGQPAVSAALTRLRDYFGDPLLLQTGRAMTPTALARALAAPVHDVLQRTQSIIFAKLEFDPATENRTIAVSASDFSATVLLTRLNQLLAVVAPGIRMRVRQTPMASSLFPNIALESLERRNNDFAIVPREYLSTTHRAEPLFEDRYVAVAWSENKQVGAQLTREAFEALPHVEAEFDDGRVRTRETLFMDNAGYSRKVSATADTFTVTAELVVGTGRIAVLQRRLALALAERLPLKIAALPFEIPPIAEYLQWKEFHDHDPVLMWVRGQMNDIANALQANG